MSDDSGAAERLCGIVTGALGDRVQCFIAYGSAATGDVLPGYSDLDLLILLRRHVTFDEAMNLHRRVVGVDVAPYAYVQPTFMLESNVSPLLVPERSWSCRALNRHAVRFSPTVTYDKAASSGWPSCPALSVVMPPTGLWPRQMFIDGHDLP